MNRILVAHSRYRIRGGEDQVVDDEVALLRRRGHSVELFVRENTALESMSAPRVAAHTLWSASVARAFGERLQAFQPELVHVHNTFPMLSPSVFWQCARRQVPVVQTLHNFRLLCADATFLRDQRICQDCLGGSLLPGVRHGCFNDSPMQTAVLAAMTGLHRAVGTYQRHVARFIALNPYCRDQFIAGGLPAGRIRIKPNFVDNPRPPAAQAGEGGLYVGRLADEKGFGVLLAAARLLDREARDQVAPGQQSSDRQPPDERSQDQRSQDQLSPDQLSPDLQAIGDGPMADQARQGLGTRWLGRLDPADTLAAISRARFVVVPSICLEQFPRVLVEAFSCGVPVIASRLGALAEIVRDGETGLLFEPGNAADLATKMRWAQAHPQACHTMGQAAYAEYRSRYTAERNYDELLAIYREAIAAGAPLSDRDRVTA